MEKSVEQQNKLLGDINTDYQVILLKYTKETKVEACLWKYFFSLCGHWVIDLENNYGIEKDNPDVHYLNICTEEEFDGEINSKYIYFIRESALSENHIKKGNVFYFKWEKRESFKKILSSIDPNKELEELFDIFLESGLWEAAWLNNNRPRQIYNWENLDNTNALWKEKIVSVARNVQKILENFDKSNYSTQFMKWSCKYLEWNHESAYIRDQKTIEICNSADIKVTSHSPLNLLSAKIYGLSFLKKYNFCLLNAIPKNQRTNETITDLFYINNAIYGEEDTIKIFMQFFKDWKEKNNIYFNDEHFYIPLIYCKVNIEYIKDIKNRENIWTSFSRFNELMKKLRNRVKEDSISTEDYVYIYNCLNKINYIFEYIFGMKHHVRDFNEFINTLEPEKGFKNLIRKMTPLEEQELREKEIINALQNYKGKRTRN